MSDEAVRPTLNHSLPCGGGHARGEVASERVDGVETKRDSGINQRNTQPEEEDSREWDGRFWNLDRQHNAEKRAGHDGKKDDEHRASILPPCAVVETLVGEIFHNTFHDPPDNQAGSQRSNIQQVVREEWLHSPCPFFGPSLCSSVWMLLLSACATSEPSYDVYFVIPYGLYVPPHLKSQRCRAQPNEARTDERDQPEYRERRCIAARNINPPGVFPASWRCDSASSR